MDVVVVLVILAPILFFTFRRHTDPVRRARTLRRTAMVLMTATLVSMGLFVALQDPGGWKWAGAVAAAAVPLAAIAVVAWFRPTWAVPPLAVLTAVAVVGIARDWDFGAFEGGSAVGASALVGAAVGATALGHRRALEAGVILLAIGLTPIVAGVQTVYMVPAVVYGALYVVSDRLSRRLPAPTIGRRRPGQLRDAA